MTGVPQDRPPFGPEPRPAPAPRSAFVTTQWTRVLLAGQSADQEAQDALAALCRDYWRPLYHFARQRGFSPEDSQDLTQGFILSLLERNGLSRADRERGRFRTFLVSSFRHYISNSSRDARALKRGGGNTVCPLEPDPEEGYARQAWHGITPELEYERSWAVALLGRAHERLRTEYARAGRAALFESLHPHLTGISGRPGYARIATELGISEGTATVAMHRMRRRYGEILREEIAATIADPAEIEDELRHLVTVVSTVPPHG